MAEIKVGDLVRWETGDRSRVGVVESIDPDGTATLKVQTASGSTEEKIKSDRLEVITSTTEPASE